MTAFTKWLSHNKMNVLSTNIPIMAWQAMLATRQISMNNHMISVPSVQADRIKTR